MEKRWRRLGEAFGESWGKVWYVAFDFIVNLSRIYQHMCRVVLISCHLAHRPLYLLQVPTACQHHPHSPLAPVPLVSVAAAQLQVVPRLLCSFQYSRSFFPVTSALSHSLLMCT